MFGYKYVFQMYFLISFDCFFSFYFYRTGVDSFFGASFAFSLRYLSSWTKL